MLTRQFYSTIPLSYEHILRKELNVKNRLTIFEIGSCECEDTIKLARLFPNSIIHAIEPILNNRIIGARYLRNNKITNALISFYAISDFIGFSEMYVSSGHPNTIPKADWDYGNKSSSLLKPYKHLEKLDWCKFNKKEKVAVITLDDYVKNMPDDIKFDKIDFMQMDVQGCELKVLKGAKNILPKIKLIYMEVSNEEYYKGQPLKKDVEKFMIKNNFKLIAEDGDINSGNQMWRNLL